MTRLVCRDCGDDWDERHEQDMKQHGERARCFIVRGLIEEHLMQGHSIVQPLCPVCTGNT